MLTSTISQGKETGMAISEELDPTSFLSTIADNEDAKNADREPVGVTVAKLINLAKRHKSFTALVNLQCIKSYLDREEHEW